MKHLSVEQIETYVAGRDREVDAHLATCARCQRELAAEQRLVRALSRLERLAPSPEFAARLERALMRTDTKARRQVSDAPRPSPTWTGVAALLAALLLVVFAYQTLVGLQDSGTLDFVSLFASRPDLLSTYPTESLSALFESLPLVELALTVVLFVIALVLAQEFFLARHTIGRLTGHSKP
jgi:hypothetical protein